MGRRSINTTKSGKYMNPTDQHRKEARKRELRKNKKQRMLVRTAVLKGKDPYQIIADMERLDQMEYNVTTPPPLNEKVLKDKRRKMKETWDRLCRLYNKEDHQRFLELKRMEADYEYKRNQMIKFYESVKSAQEVAIDDIPLPSAPIDPKIGVLPMISLSAMEPPPPQSILKRPNFPLTQLKNKSPPGVPPGPPPVLSDIEDDLEDDNSEEESNKESNKRIRFSDEPNEKDSDVNEFLKELELMEKSTNSSNESTSQTIQSLQSLPSLSSQTSSSVPNQSAISSTMPAKGVPNAPPPPMMMFRAVPPPSSIRPTGSSTIPGLIVGRAGVPSGPPVMRPGLPPRMMGPRPMMPPMRSMGPSMGPTGSASNANKSGEKKSHFVTERATIEAKPQLRNLSADATRFTPVALRVKREEKGVKKVNQRTGFDSEYGKRTVNPNQSLNAPTKDDAYDQFMKEMSGLL